MKKTILCMMLLASISSVSAKGVLDTNAVDTVSVQYNNTKNTGRVLEVQISAVCIADHAFIIATTVRSPAVSNIRVNSFTQLMDNDNQPTTCIVKAQSSSSKK